LRARREELGVLLREGTDTLVGAGEVTWLTFAGGRINLTIKYALQVLMGWEVVADNVRVRAKSNSILQGEWRAAVTALADREGWATLLPKVRAALPEYRLSKFQRALPEWAQAEMVEAYLLDVDGVVDVARRAGQLAPGAADA
jgi:ATP-dependent Lhr-like helicase